MYRCETHNRPLARHVDATLGRAFTERTNNTASIDARARARRPCRSRRACPWTPRAGVRASSLASSSLAARASASSPRADDAVRSPVFLFRLRRRRSVPVLHIAFDGDDARRRAADRARPDRAAAAPDHGRGRPRHRHRARQRRVRGPRPRGDTRGAPGTRSSSSSARGGSRRSSSARCRRASRTAHHKVGTFGDALRVVVSGGFVTHGAERRVRVRRRGHGGRPGRGVFGCGGRGEGRRRSGRPRRRRRAADLRAHLEPDDVRRRRVEAVEARQGGGGGGGVVVVERRRREGGGGRGATPRRRRDGGGSGRRRGGAREGQTDGGAEAMARGRRARDRRGEVREPRRRRTRVVRRPRPERRGGPPPTWRR